MVRFKVKKKSKLGLVGWFFKLVGFLNFLFFNFDLKGVMGKCVG